MAIDTLAELAKKARKTATWRTTLLNQVSKTRIAAAHQQEWCEFIFAINETDLPLAEVEFILREKDGSLASGPISWQIDTWREPMLDQAFLFAASGTTTNGKVTSEIDFRIVKKIKISILQPVSTPIKITDVLVKHTLMAAGYRVMPIGDSITKGTGANDSIGMRAVVYNMMTTAGLNPDFVGFDGAAPYEGHFSGGKSIEDFYPRNYGNNRGRSRWDVTGTMNYFRPQMVLIHLGTNDMESGGPIAPYYDNEPDNFAQTEAGDMATLISYLLEWHNGIQGTELEHLLVCTIIPMENQPNEVITFNTEIGRIVRDFRNGRITGTPETAVKLCDQYSIFQAQPELFSTWMWDDAHPNDAGHQQMGEIYFASINQILRPAPPYFENVAWETATTGTTNYFGGHGVALADINGDGIDDIYLGVDSDGNSLAPNLYFDSRQDHSYVEEGDRRNIDDTAGSQGVLFVDIDNDGDFDLFNGHWGFPNRLYRNNGDNTFSDITALAGISSQPGNTTAVMALDIENDGDMDLYVVNSRAQNVLYVNNGDGTFQQQDRGANDVAEPDVASPGATVIDIDLDGDTDIYIAKQEGANVLFINDGTGHFSDQARQFGLADTGKCLGPVFADYDNDGYPDLVLAIRHDEDGTVPNLRIYHNNRDNTFTDKTSYFNIKSDVFNNALADFDNDGDIDLLCVSYDDYASYYDNTGTGNFMLKSSRAGGIRGGDARAAAVGDFNDDGAPDVFISRDDMLNAQLKNVMNNNNNYLKVSVTGPGGVAGGFGTRLSLFQAEKGGYHAFLRGYREVTPAQGYQVQNSPIQHFGLGNANSVDLLAEFSNGTCKLVRHIAANQTIMIAPVKAMTTPVTTSKASGDGQYGWVGMILPEPVAVRVTDSNGNPVKGVEVDFQVTRGHADMLPPVFPAAHDKVWKEAETGRKSEFVKKGIELEASDQEFVFVPDRQSGLNTTAKLTPNSGTDTLTITISDPGSYYLWARVSGYDGLTTQIDIQLDDGPRATWAFTATSAWSWQRVQVSGGDNWLQNMNQGDHNLILTFAAGGPHIDKILLSSSPDYEPAGFGDSDGSDPLVTDGDGIARRRILLTEMGEITIAATAQHQGQQAGSPVLFTSLRATSAAPNHLVKVSGDSLSGNGGDRLAEPLVIRCLDANDVPVTNASILYSVVKGGGSFSTGPVVPTNSDGYASIYYVLGLESSVQTVTATVASFPEIAPIPFTTFALDIASDITYVSGSGHTGSAGNFLEQPLTVRVTTASGTPVELFEVYFSIEDGAGLLDNGTILASNVPVRTDAEGLARVRWQLGEKVGSHKVKATATGVTGAPITFTATALAGAPERLIKVSGDSLSAPVWKQLNEPIDVQITDRFGNGIVNQPVTFAVLNGGGKVSDQENTVGQDSITLLTAPNGHANAWWQLGRYPGTWNNMLTVHANYQGRQLEHSPVHFHATATADAGVFLVKLSGDGQSGGINTELDSAFCVQVQDQYHNPVSNFPITFMVVTGDGNFDGQPTTTIYTNDIGHACASLTLGCTIGPNSHQVKVFGPGLVPEFVLFTASASPGPPWRIKLYAGNNQSGIVETQLESPLIVQVTDACGNGSAGTEVKFSITRGNGHFEGQAVAADQYIVTETNGLAQVQLTLGTLAGDNTNIVEAVAMVNNEPLYGAPVRFYASARPGAPFMISDTLGHNQVVAVNDTIVLGVKVQDRAGNPVPGVQVRFDREPGTGNFVPTSAVVGTGMDGIGNIRFYPTTIGNRVIYATVNHDNHHIIGSPARFDLVVTDRLTNLHYVDGNNQDGMVNWELAHPLVVKILDDMATGVPGFPVLFSVTSGDGTLDGTGEHRVTKNTDGTGMARITWKLGTGAGINNQVVQVRARVSGLDIPGSPVIFTASAGPGTPDAVVSNLVADSPVPANGSARAEIRARVMDQFGNPVANRSVLLAVSDCPECVLQQPAAPTASTGITSGYVRATRPGTAVVRAQIIDTGAWFQQPAEVRFIETSADRITYVGGNGQCANAGTRLPDPLDVMVTDPNDNPVPDYPVQFEFVAGSGQFLNGALIHTNQDGIAGVEVILGLSPGLVQVNASAYGLTGSPVSFNALEALEPALHDLVLLNQALVDTVGQFLDEFIKIRSVDINGNPVAGIALDFIPEHNSSLFVYPTTDTTDASGIAQTRVRLGIVAGPYHLQARAVNFSLTRDIIINALPGRLIGIKKAEGDGQTGIVGHKLPNPIITRAVDLYDNGIAGSQIAYTVSQNGARLIPASPIRTNNQGFAAIEVVLGLRTGTYKVNASVPDVPGPALEFSFLAIADSPKVMIKLSGDKQYGRPGEELAHPLQVWLRDLYDNPVPAVPLQVTILTGGGSIKEGNQIGTDNFGIATAHWLLGNRANTQECKITVIGNNNLFVIFTACGSNNAPLFTTPDWHDTTITEMQTIEFAVHANDPEGDLFTIYPDTLPAGARFVGNVFTWTPDFCQAGEHFLTFSAKDTMGSKSEKQIRITVKNVNRSPQIFSMNPTDSAITMYAGGEYTFSVVAGDPDNDPLRYRWLSADTLVSETATLTIKPETRGEIPGYLQVLVFDREDTISHTWSIATTIKLSNFTARAITYRGVQLSWQVDDSAISTTAGFQILRGNTNNGPLKVISDLIRPNPEGTYVYYDGSARAGMEYDYAIEDIDLNGVATRHEAIAVTLSLPEKYVLHQNFPNPFNLITTIRFELPTATEFSLIIYNTLGELVSTLVQGRYDAGYHSVTWNGQTDSGSAAGSGIYYCVLKARGLRKVMKMVLLR